MIYDKVKVYVTPRVANILAKDAESFEFFKRDGVTPNKNALLTNLIVNYSSVFELRQAELADKIRHTLEKSANLNEQNINNLCCEILEKVNDDFSADAVEKYSSLVSLKPTKESQALIDYTEEYKLNGCSLSEYYRNMFSRYASFSQDKREQIIFKKQYDAVTMAIKQNKRIFITTRNEPTRKLEIQPFALSQSKEEMHTYVLAKFKRACRTYRLSRILSVAILSENNQFNKDDIAIFEKMQTFGPQFFYKPYEEDIVVKLTNDGIHKFHTMYVHRPIPKRINGDLYNFDCSTMQVLTYFSRFGADALIVSPKNIRNIMLAFHKKALVAYTSQENN